MTLKATSTWPPFITTLTFTLNMRPNIVNPSNDTPLHYYVVGTTSSPIYKTYSWIDNNDLVDGKPILLEAMLIDNSTTPNFMTIIDYNVNHISVNVNPLSEDDFGEYEVKIRATLGTSPLVTVDESFVVKYVIMKVGFIVP